MIFRQIFDKTSSTYTYILASRRGGEALIIDPVIENVDKYLKLMHELDLKLVKAVDTHCHADHITGLGKLRDTTHCITVMGQKTSVDMVSMRVDDGDTIDIENISLGVLYTPGHTDDSYSFTLEDRIFTGDTLLIRGTGRTDFQNGDSIAAYKSLFDKVLKLPEDTLVYPGHDYNGNTVSTIGEERAHNPRLQVTSAEQYAEIMNSLNLPNPRMMDEAVPVNLNIGYKPDDPEISECTLSVDDVKHRMSDNTTLFVDLREDSERAKYGIIKGSLHAPYSTLHDAVKPDGLLHAMAEQTGKSLLVYCAYGERSALALQILKEAGIENACHLGGGMDAWRNDGGEVVAL